MRHAGPIVQLVLASGLAKFGRLHHHIANVVGDLVGLPQIRAQANPRSGVTGRGQGPSAGGGHKQRPSFGSLILAQIGRGLALPSLPRHNAVR